MHRKDQNTEWDHSLFEGCRDVGRAPEHNQLKRQRLSNCVKKGAISFFSIGEKIQDREHKRETGLNLRNKLYSWGMVSFR